MNHGWRTILLAVSIAFVTATSSAQTRSWFKDHDKVVVDNQILGEWTFIRTVDGLKPFKLRRLYRTDTNQRLVIRFEGAASGPQRFSVTHVETGESVSLAITESSITATMQMQQFVMSKAACEGFSGPDGKECPPSVKAAAAAFIANGSSSFREALKNFATTGCSYGKPFYFEAARVGFVLFPTDTDCTVPPLDMATGPEQIVREFDPNTTPPSAFDALFGAAYYE